MTTEPILDNFRAYLDFIGGHSILDDTHARKKQMVKAAETIPEISRR
jgi:hypothetical protein